MKMLATGLLLGATVVFLLARWGEAVGAPDWVGYVRATAEAAMVGALADWFAVTALFRRPMGLPIPHTAIIPRKKDQLGDSLGDFVGENFLSEDVVRDKLGRVEVARRVGEWIGQVPHAERVTAELATAAKGVVTVLRDEDVQEVIDQVLVRKLLERPAGPPLGAVLEGILNDGAHHRLVDLVCDKAYDWVTTNHTTVLRIVERRAPTWSPRFVDGIIADRVFLEVSDVRLGGEDGPRAPAAEGDRRLPGGVRRRPAARRRHDRAGRADQVPDPRAPGGAAVHRPGVGHGQEVGARRRRGSLVGAAAAGARRAPGAGRAAERRTPSCAARSTAGWWTRRATWCATTAARSRR